jgi:hypothetical protein
LPPRNPANATASVRPSGGAGPLPYFAALSIAAALVFVWVGLRSL